ncbi:AtpZ/AtpI family protein [Parapedobacter indicus]|uniref:Putative F0F1-ATPase subunit Ca2+/Mg2+ transporter n=1 Tax=Parapedobacter indicus TaxID=1477437 RepID=A0A1I3F5X9_9SPHI|nr:AtpZ/AtpI family protein [Parapedobacter indicus]PPL03575.1 putative F0F1-ATPase subunit (Ca2+/Mg2+ transporter) [Parapedobacter indicus]SFI06583.1 Putative F0F1-ATPase subunit Ca2+/Mg2+ transporter [Parapedobacter indicus]
MKNPKRSLNNALGKYAYFTGVGFQMLAIIGLFTYIGYRIDQSRNAERPIWTALFALVGVCISIYTVIRAVTRRK